MTISYAVVFEDARTVSGQAGTWVEAVSQVRRIAQDSFYTQGKREAIFYAFSDDVVHKNGRDLDILAADAEFRDRQIARIAADLKAMHLPSSRKNISR
jgi:hypothetical protein